MMQGIPAADKPRNTSSMEEVFLQKDGDANTLRRIGRQTYESDKNDVSLSADSVSTTGDHLSDKVVVPAGVSVLVSPAKSKAGATVLSLKMSFLIMSMYIFCGMMGYICIRYTKTKGMKYNDSLLVLSTELVKMFVSVLLRYYESGEFFPKTLFFASDRMQVWKSGALFAVPALLYAIYNNMTFFNLSALDPGTYQVFMQVRIPITGLLTMVILKTRISVRQWFGLMLLTLGVASKFYSGGKLDINKTVFFVVIQASLSSLAGTYNELVLKKDAWKSIHVQNFFIYFFAVLFNFAIGLLTGASYSNTDMRLLLDPMVILIVLLGAATGLSASLILKFINVIVKSFGSAFDVLLTAVVAAILLNEPLTKRDVVAAVLVMAATSIYYTKGIGSSQYVRLPTR